MRVIHYITDFTGASGPQAAAARMMMLSTSRLVESHLVTSVPLAEDYVRVLAGQCNVQVHLLKGGAGRGLSGMLSALSGIGDVLKTLQPDVVHVHGAWDWRAAMMERLARRRGIVTLVSPHRGMSSELLNIDFWSVRLPRLIAYQALMVRNCTAVIAVSDKERDDIMALGLKKRIEVLPAMSQGEGNMERLGAALVTCYRKALDSTYARKLTQRERDVVAIALRSVVADDDVETTMPDIQGVSFRRIYFHAHDEDVMRQFIDGCRKMQIQAPPPLNVTEVPRYRNPKAKALGALAGMPGEPDMRKIPADREAERHAVRLIYKARALALQRLTLRQYAELYALFRHADFDEGMVADELRRLRLLRFTRRLQRRLAEMFGLKAGYNITE